MPAARARAGAEPRAPCRAPRAEAADGAGGGGRSARHPARAGTRSSSRRRRRSARHGPGRRRGRARRGTTRAGRGRRSGRRPARAASSIVATMSAAAIARSCHGAGARARRAPPTCRRVKVTSSSRSLPPETAIARTRPDAAGVELELQRARLEGVHLARHQDAPVVPCRHLGLLPDADDRRAVLGMTRVVLLTVGEPRARPGGHHDPRLRAVDAGLERALRRHELAVLVLPACARRGTRRCPRDPARTSPTCPRRGRRSR